MKSSGLALSSVIAIACGFPTLASAEQGSWTFSPEVFYGTRSKASNAINIPDFAPAPGEILYGFKDLESDRDWGAGLTVAYRLNAVQSVWLRGFHWGGFGGDGRLFTVPGAGTIGNTSTTFSAIAGNNTITNNTSGGFTAFDYDQKSSVWGLEANFQQQIVGNAGTRLAAFAGPRFIRFSDRLSMRFYEDPDDVAGTDNENQSLSIRTRNNLYGGQVGARLDQQLVAGLTLTLQGALGLYANHAERSRTFLEEEGNTTVVNDTRSQTRAAWSADLGATLSWQVLSNVSVDLGYTALRLNNVSLAPSHFERVATVDDPSIRADSAIWVHGVRFGTSIRY